MNSLDFLNGRGKIDPNRKRAGTITELLDLKTLKVKPNTHKKLLDFKEKLHYQLNITKGKSPSFDFALNFLMNKFESTMGGTKDEKSTFKNRD